MLLHADALTLVGALPAQGGQGGRRPYLAYDFLEAALADGSSIPMLTVRDEFAREGLALDVTRTTSVERVLEVLRVLLAQHGALGPPAQRQWAGVRGAGGVIMAGTLPGRDTVYRARHAMAALNGPFLVGKQAHGAQ